MTIDSICCLLPGDTLVYMDVLELSLEVLTYTYCKALNEHFLFNEINRKKNGFVLLCK